MRFDRSMRRTCMVLAFLVPVVCGASAAFAQSSGTLDERPLRLQGDEPSYVDLAAGVFNIQQHAHSPMTGEGRVEFRYGEKLFFIGPAAGVLVNARGGIFGYGGIYSDITWGRFVLTPFGGAGFYRRGSGIDLGGTFEFRLSATGAYELSDGSRIGIEFAHISNANSHVRNPGDNELLLSYSIPLNLGF